MNTHMLRRVGTTLGCALLLLLGTIQPLYAATDLGVTASNGDFSPGRTNGDYYLMFSNDVELVDGDKVQVEFAPEFTLHPTTDMDMYSYSSIFDSTYDLVVDEVGHTLTKTVDLYEGSYGLDAFEIYIYDMDNPALAGEYPVTVRILDGSDIEKESITRTITIAPKMDYVYTWAEVDGDRTSMPDSIYHFEGLTTTSILSGDSVRLIFPETTDLTNATIDSLIYENMDTIPVSYDSYTIDNSAKTITFRITDPADSEDNYFNFVLGGITTPQSYGYHYVEMQLLDNVGDIKEISVSDGGIYLQSPADAAQDRYEFSFVPEYSLTNGDIVEIDFPPEFQLFPGTTQMYMNSMNSIFETVSNTPVINLANNTISLEIESLYMDKEPKDTITVELYSFTNPINHGVYPVKVTVRNATNTRRDIMNFDVRVGSEFNYMYVNVDSNSRGAENVTYTFEGEPDIPVEDGDVLEVCFPGEVGLDDTSYNVSYTNHTGIGLIVMPYEMMTMHSMGGPTQVERFRMNRCVSFQTFSSAPSEGPITIEVTGVVNSDKAGNQYVSMGVIRGGNNDSVARSSIYMNPPEESSFNTVELSTPLVSVPGVTYSLSSFYPNTRMENGWQFTLHFPETADLSEVDPEDITVENGGFTNPVTSVDAMEKTITFIADGTDDRNGISLTVADVINPTVSGEQRLFAEITFNGLLQETISTTYFYANIGQIKMENVDLTTFRPSMVSTYDVAMSMPLDPQDGWTLEVDFDDTMDLSAWDFDTGFTLSGGGWNREEVEITDVALDTLTNTFTIQLSYSSQNSSNSTFYLTLRDLVNPTASGLTNIQFLLKDQDQHVAGTGQYDYYVADRVEVRAQESTKGGRGSYTFAFTPDFDVADGEVLIFSFPEEFDISHVDDWEIYFQGVFDASAEDVLVDTVANEVSFIVDTDFASIPDSQGNEIIVVIDDIKNPLVGSSTPYELQVTHIYGGGPPLIVQNDGSTVYPLLASSSPYVGPLIAPVAGGGGQQVMNGYVFFAPPTIITPTVALSNNTVSQTATYSVDFTPTVGVDGGWMIRLIFPDDTDISGVTDTVADVRVTGGYLQTNTVTVDAPNRTIDVIVSCSSCSAGTGTGLLNIEVDGVINASTAGVYDLEMEIYDDSQAGQMAGTGQYTLVGAPANTAPNAPVDPYANTSAHGATTGNSSPTILGSTSVVFTAEHSDPDGDSATHYEIEIYNSPTLTIPNLVHSTNKTVLPTAIADGSRSPAPGIATTATLTNGNTYYWRIRYYDDTNTPGTPGAWSATSSFTVDTSAPSVTRTPANAATNVPRNQTFEVEMSDASSSVDISTVNIQVDGTNVVTAGVLNTVDFNFTASPVTDGATVTYEFTAVNPSMFSYGSTVNFVVQGSDTTGNAISGPSQTTSFTFANAPVVDNIPPNITTTPTAGASNVPRSQAFVVTVTDGEVDVDISSVDIVLDGTNVVTDGALNTAEFTFTTIPAGDAPSVTYVFRAVDPTRFTYGSTVNFDVEATDSNANTGSVHRTFTFAPAPTSSGGGTGSGGGGYMTEYSNEGEADKPSAETTEEPEEEIHTETCAYFKDQVNGQQYADINDSIMNNYATFLLDNGIILGRNATEFGSKDAMTRSEVLRSIIQANCEQFSLENVTTPPFPDVRVDHKDAVFIDAAKRAGIVSGYKEDGTYRPDRFISRAEAVKVVFQEVLGDMVPQFTGTTQVFVDVHEDAWYVGYIAFGVETGILKDNSSHIFSPNNAITREDIATLLVDTLRYRDQLSATPKPSAPDEEEDNPLSPENTVRDEDVVLEPIQACSYFEDRLGNPKYRDLVGNPELAGYAEKLLSFGVVVGRNVDTFAMFDQITRSEILRIMIQANCDTYTLEPVLEKPFPDVPVEHKDAVFIQAAKVAGVVSGYGDGTFKPDTTISRAEILKILLEAALNKAFQRFDGALQQYSDIPADAWYARYLRFVSTQGIMEGGTFSPEEMGTRAFIAETLLHILEFKESFME